MEHIAQQMTFVAAKKGGAKGGVVSALLLGRGLNCFNVCYKGEQPLVTRIPNILVIH